MDNQKGLSEESKKAPIKTATERLSSLENIVAASSERIVAIQNQAEGTIATINDLIQALQEILVSTNQVGRRIDRLEQNLSMLSARQGVIVKLASSGTLNEENYVNEVVRLKTESLKAEVDYMVKSGALVASEGPVEASDYLVTEELDADEKVVNPRAQFGLETMTEEVKNKVVGAKLGDVIKMSDEYSLRILEIYSIQNPNKEEDDESKS